MSNLKAFSKKLISMALAGLMVAGMGTAVAAKRYDDVNDDHDHRTQIDILSDIGVIVGTTDKEFEPDTDVTREQMAMLLFRLMLGRSNAGTTNSTAFNDLYDDTYNGAISWANAAGYIKGTSDNTFEPTGGITLQDAMTMAVRALGQSTANMDRGYPWTYIDAAIKLGLDHGLSNLDYEDTLTRSETAALLYNALTAEYLITKNPNGLQSVVVPTTIIEYVFGYDLDNGTIIATNNYAIDDADLVIKNGYVTVRVDNGRVMTVSFEDMGLEGSPDKWLGKSVKLIYKNDTQNKVVNVLGASHTGRSETVNTATVNDGGKTVTIGGVKYNIVETLSDSLSTNHNELLVYVYDDDGKLAQLKNNNALSAHLGFTDIELIFDNSESDTANRAIVKNYKYSRLDMTDGKINLAGGLTSDKLTGGIANEVEAKSGDYVLYYYNPANKRLEIREILTVKDVALVTKISGNKVTIGDAEYTAGNAASGVSAESILAQLKVGGYASVVVKNNVILAVHTGVQNVTASTYLTVIENVVPVYNNGALRYVTTAIIDGVKTGIVTNNSSVNVGDVYRYTTDANGIYTLIAKGSAFFAQSTELVDSFTVKEAATLDRGTNAHYTLGSINFVTDKDTVIVVKNGDNYEFGKGEYTSTIKLSAGANVTAIYRNSIGNVEVLSHLYISDGVMSNVDSAAEFVKILKKSGSELKDGIVYTVYEVYNHNTAKRETRLSLSDSLAAGVSYALELGGNISNGVIATPTTGIVTGYTASTISIGNTVHKLSSDVKINRINSDLSLTALTMSQINGSIVEFITVGGEVKSIITSSLGFSASYSADGKAVVITPNADLSSLGAQSVSIVSVIRDGKAIDVNGWDIKVEGNSLRIPLYWISAGNYTLTFSVLGTTHTVNVTLPEINPEG